MADNQDMELASQWFVNNVPDYKDKNIYADLIPISAGISRPM